MFKLIWVLLFVMSFLIGCTDDSKLGGEQVSIKNYENQFFTQLSVNDFKKELSNSGIILIDVRTPKELLIYGKINDNQLLIDINGDNFSKQIVLLDKNKKYLVYCWHGNRSAVVRDYMKSKGFTYVKDLKGGIDAWTKAGEVIIK